jgi:hypothetical protein
MISITRKQKKIFKKIKKTDSLVFKSIRKIGTTPTAGTPATAGFWLQQGRQQEQGPCFIEIKQLKKIIKAGMTAEQRRPEGVETIRTERAPPSVEMPTTARTQQY